MSDWNQSGFRLVDQTMTVSYRHRLFRSTALGASLFTLLALAPLELQAKPTAAPLWTEGQGQVIKDPKYDPGQSLAPMVSAVQEAVVSVTGTSKRASRRGQGFDGFPPWVIPPGAGPQSPGIAQGSGFIISDQGWVVTNHHVVEGQEKIKITLYDGRTLDAKVVGSDPQTDVALLRIAPKDRKKALPYAHLGSSEKLAVGDWVVAIGNPMGLDHSVTRGIISAKSRGDLGLYRQGYADFLQTDAAISPGNSGGPLFNLRGEVIGINTAINRMGNDLGFAVPIDQAKHVISQLQRYGKVRRGYLGIRGQVVQKASLGPNGLRKGALVQGVQPGGPADKAGLRENDRILSLNGEAVRDFKTLRQRVSRMEPGKTLKLEIQRGKIKKNISIKLAEIPDPKTQRQAAASQESRRRGLYDQRGPRLGVVVDTRQNNLKVVEISDPSGVGADLGLKPGDIIEKVNGRSVKNIRDLKRALSSSPRKVQIRYLRNGQPHNATLQVR